MSTNDWLFVEDKQPSHDPVCINCFCYGCPLHDTKTVLCVVSTRGCYRHTYYTWKDKNPGLFCSIKDAYEHDNPPK